MTLEIKNYSVSTNRQRSASNYHRRAISLEPKSPTAQVQHIVIYFFVQEQIANDSDIGYQTPSTTKFVVGYAPISDFADMYAILQSEKPVYFNWHAGNDNKVSWFGISSNPEPLGEGPKDVSA